MTRERKNVSATLAAIAALRKGRPTAIRVTNDYNDLIGYNGQIGDPATPRSAYLAVKHAVDLFAAISCRLAAQYHAVCADTYHAFNGPHGLRDAGPLLAPDHTRCSGAALRELFPPAQRQGRGGHAVPSRKTVRTPAPARVKGQIE
jgi:hypothetical protein